MGVSFPSGVGHEYRVTEQGYRSSKTHGVAITRTYYRQLDVEKIPDERLRIAAEVVEFLGGAKGWDQVKSPPVQNAFFDPVGRIAWRRARAVVVRTEARTASATRSQQH